MRGGSAKPPPRRDAEHAGAGYLSRHTSWKREKL
jgi:hypothetical protein